MPQQVLSQDAALPNRHAFGARAAPGERTGMSRRFDTIVVGTGVAGSAIARRCRAAGRKVAIIDERPFGGTCQLRGCDPKKVLRAAAEPVAAIERLAEPDVGVFVQVPVPDWRDLMKFKRRFTDPVPSSKEDSFADAGIVALHGTARFISADTLAVGEDLFEADSFVIAAGSKPAPLPIEGAELVASSEDFLNLDTLPRSIVMVGGGYIAM